MRLKVLLNIGTAEEGVPPLREGVHDIDDEALALKLLERGWAVPYSEEEEKLDKLKAVSGPPAIMTAPISAANDAANEHAADAAADAAAKDLKQQTEAAAQRAADAVRSHGVGTKEAKEALDKDAKDNAAKLKEIEKQSHEKREAARKELDALEKEIEKRPKPTPMPADEPAGFLGKKK